MERMKTFLVQLANGKRFTVKAEEFSRPQMAIYVTNEIDEEEECVATFNLSRLDFIADVRYLGKGFLKDK